MAGMPEGYDDADVEQQGLSRAANGSKVDVRTPFMHDRDRVLYSSAFAALAGKAQVVASGELAGYHTRLTHSLKVAQIGRRLTELLRARNDGRGPDPDLVEVACLAHDIGHPPFGHAGEEALSHSYERLTGRASRRSFRRQTEWDGFEGNAQNLRILTYLSVRTEVEASRGLHLSRAALDATMKYPWMRSGPKDPKRHRKFGIYREDLQTATWVLADVDVDTSQRPVEEQIMDWADDVTYAVHDLEDFYRTGFIPFETMFSMFDEDLGEVLYTDELVGFLLHVQAKWEKRGKILDLEHGASLMQEIENRFELTGRFNGSADHKVRVYSMTGKLIEHFLEGVELRPTAGSLALTRYGAVLYIPPEKQLLCDLLKELIWYYVIDRPALASQQAGQRRVVSKLLEWHCEDPNRLLPLDRREEMDEHGDRVRAACDHVASMTERQALALYRRMNGNEPGAITDQHR